MPNKILLTGKSGIGKSLLVDKFLNCIFNDNKLIKSNVHPNILKIKKSDKKNIDIDQIREMMQFQNRSSFNDNDRFIVIEDVENLNINSSNALLKSIESQIINFFY